MVDVLLINMVDWHLKGDLNMSDNITLKDLQNLLAEVAQAQKKTEAATKETRAMQQKTEAAQQKTAEAIQDLTQESKKTEAVLQDLTRESKKTETELRAQGKRMEQDAKNLREEIKEAKNLFTGQWGKLMESLVEGDLVKMLKGKGIDVETTMQNIKKKRDDEQWEVDILALNGEDVVVVEVKTMLRVKDVKRFMERTLQNFTGIFPVYAGKRILGAVAYLRAEESAETYAEKNGLFAIRATGSSASIVNGENFKPRVFGE